MSQLNGLKAIDQAKKHKPHLIILDVMMPEMDGIEACERLRAIPELSQSIITLTEKEVKTILNLQDLKPVG